LNLRYMEFINKKYINAGSAFCKTITAWLCEVKKTFFCLFLIHIAAVLAIFRSNTYYIDDMGRACFGYQGWDNFSRYLSNFLSGFLHADSYLSDISPLPQIVALAILSLADVIVICIVTGKTKVSFWHVAAVLPLGLCPYFLECISYKYDAPYMALSIFASVVPFLIFGFQEKYGIFFLGSVLGILMMCTTYQASSGIFPMLVIFICIRRWNEADEQKKIGKFLLVSILAYGTGIAIFRIFIMEPVESYVSSSIPPVRELVPLVIRNLNQYLWYIRSDYPKMWKVLIFMLCVLFVFAMGYKSKRKKFAACLLAICALAAMGLMSFGIYPLLEAPLYAPRAMYGAGVFLAVIGVYVTSMDLALMKIPAVVLGWVFFVFTFTYGNALHMQNEYTDFRMVAVIEELNGLDEFASNEVKNVQIAGTIGYAPALTGVMERYGILKRLVPVTFAEGWMWAGYKFYNYYGLKNVVSESTVDLRTCNLPVIKDTMYFTILT